VQGPLGAPRQESPGEDLMAYRKYTVKQGDCISNIAFKYGFFPDTIWNDSKNSKLRQDRKDQMTFSVRAKYKEDEQEIDVEVLKWVNNFTVERIPVAFDGNKIYPIAWKAKPSIPEAEADAE
jgi:hypothetical protein